MNKEQGESLGAPIIAASQYGLYTYISTANSGVLAKKEYSDMILVREWLQQDKNKLSPVATKEVDWRSPVSGAFVYQITFSGEDT